MPRTKKLTTVKEVRESLKISQSELAKALNVSVSSISAYETGRVNPPKKVLDTIKELYGVELPVREVKKGRKRAASRKHTEKKASLPTLSETPIVIQSPFGGAITPAEILEKVGQADTIYVRVDENKAYWVRGEESGSVDLW